MKIKMKSEIEKLSPPFCELDTKLFKFLKLMLPQQKPNYLLLGMKLAKLFKFLEKFPHYCYN